LKILKTISTRLRAIIFEIGLIVLAIIATNVITIISAKNTLQSTVINDINRVVVTLSNTIDATRNLKLEQLNKNINVADYILKKHDLIEVNEYSNITVKNQNTGNKYLTKINKWKYNGKILQYDESLVDEIKSLTGTNVTIFQKIDSGFVRIATNIMDSSNNRAVNTYIPFSSPVLKDINKKDRFIYSGRAFVVNDWYLTSYKPIVINNEVKGLLYVGLKEKELGELKKTFNDLNIDKNITPFCIDRAGRMLIHPSDSGENISNLEYFQHIIKDKEGIYKFYDEDKKDYCILSYKYYSAYEMYIVCSAYQGNFLDNFRREIINTSIVAGIITLLLISILIFFFTKTINALHNAVKDLSETNKELLTTKKALQQSEKLASMGQLAAGIAHEINNPLGVIMMYCNIILDDSDENDPKRKDLELIVEQSERCKKIVGGLLNFARKSKVNKTNINVHNLIEKSVKSLLLPSNVKITTDFKIVDPFMMIDIDQMVQVFTNIIKNAIDAMPNGGHVDILTEGNENDVCFHIKDNGTGIDPKSLDKLFEPFFTTKGKNNGTGLGLPISYGIIKMHKGNIKVISNTDKSKGSTGTTFIITIPRINSEV